MSSRPISNKVIFNLLQTRLGSTRKVKCQCGTAPTQYGTHFSILMLHLERKDPAELWSARSRNPSPYQQCLSILLCCPKVVTIHEWLPYVVHSLRPFSVGQSDYVITHIRYDRISFRAFKHYMSVLTTFVGHNISRCLSDCFLLVFEEQTTPEAHYTAGFATLPYQNSLGNILLVTHYRYLRIKPHKRQMRTSCSYIFYWKHSMRTSVTSSL